MRSLNRHSQVALVLAVAYANSGVVLALPNGVLNLVQEGLLERAFHDGLFPALQYRSEALFQKWEGNTGVEMFMTRPGLLRPKTKPLTPGVDPTPQAVTYEQWVARIDQYGDSVDTHMPTSAVAQSDLLMRNIQQLGLQAGQSLNRIPRDAIFKAYLSGSTVLVSAALAGDTSIRVAAVNGFTDVVGGVGNKVRPVPVSPSAPLPVSIATVGTRNVIGVVLDNPDDPFGPGTLILSAVIGGAGAPARAPVLASNRPKIIRAGGGDSVDAIGAADTLSLQDVINVANSLRHDNVPPHEDGFYHAHISTNGNSQVFADPVYQRLNQSLPEHVTYKEGFIGAIGGVLFFMNNEAPDSLNSGDLTQTGTNAFYAEEIGAEVINETAVAIGRILVTGKGAMYELGLDESAYVSEAGVTGKIGEFDIVNNGLTISTERIRLILRAPINRMQDQVAATWSITCGFPIPSDVTASSGPERYKRARVIEHAL